MVARNRLVLSGPMSTTEVWSVSLHFAGAGGEVVGGSANLSAWAAACFTWMDTNISSLITGVMGTLVSIDTIRAYQYGDSGPAIAVGEALGSIEGSGTSPAPFQTCLVASLRCDQIGARYRGRMYWPAPGADISAGLFTGLAPSVNIADAFAELLTGLGESASPVADLLPMVYSPTYDLLTPVTSVQVDTVPDVQRRRADNLAGTVFASPVPNAIGP